MKFAISVLLAAACVSAMSQSAPPATARHLAEWRRGAAADQNYFDEYVLASYQSLRTSKLICPPSGRTDVENENAALEAARMGVDEGVFDVDGPPMDAVTDALAFWYPCTARR